MFILKCIKKKSRIIFNFDEDHQAIGQQAKNICIPCIGGTATTF